MNIATQSPKSRVILGLMTFGPNTAAGARITSLDEYTKCLDYFQAQGYNEVDTARKYVAGAQEAFTAEANWRDRGLTLATKIFPDNGLDHSPTVLRQTLETSLKELGTDCVDIYYLHKADRTTPFEVTLEECNKLHKEGKFVQLGLSNFAAYEVAEMVTICKERSWVRPTIFQAMYNAITRSIEAELIPACRRYGIDVVIYNPLAGGLFSGKIKSLDVPAEGRFSNTAEGIGKMYRQRYFKEPTFEALRLIESAAKKHDIPLVEVGLRWCRHHSALKMDGRDRDGIIIGVSSFAQLEQNLQSIEKGPLPDDLVQALDDAWSITKATTGQYWQNFELKYTYDTPI